jgi:hypothetical protein
MFLYKMLYLTSFFLALVVSNNIENDTFIRLGSTLNNYIDLLIKSYLNFCAANSQGVSPCCRACSSSASFSSS